MSHSRNSYTPPALPAARRMSYQPGPVSAPAVMSVDWPPLSASYPPPTPGAPRIHTLPLPPATPSPYQLRDLPTPSPAPQYSPPRSAPAAPAVLPFPPGRSRAPAALPIPIPGAHPATRVRGGTVSRPGPGRFLLPPQSATTPFFPPSVDRSPLPLPPGIDTANALLIPSSPSSPTNSRRSHAPLSLALSSPHQVFYGGRTYATGEHLFQAMKFKYREDIAEAVRTSSDPGRTAEMYGQFVRPDWEARKGAKVYEVVYHKYIQHPHLVVELLETGNRQLIDAGDPYGNHLGGALMVLRREYHQGERDSLG